MTTRRALLILHAHLPYVPLSQPEALEERWFCEALCETYLPLLACFAANDALRAALSLSPPLLGMLGERPRLERCRRLISRRIALAERERARVTSAFAHLPDYYAARDRALLAQLDQYDDDLLGAFAALARAGRLELFTAAGTHPFLPYLSSRHWQRVHVELACDAFAQAFGQAPRGVWLPECAYEPGLDTVLAACGVAWSVVDGPAFARARPVPPAGVLRPAFTPAGVAVFAREPELCAQVWSAEHGYPGSGEYREFYRDIAYDRPLETLQDVLIEGRVRADTGLKYHRVTAWGTPLGEKAPYLPEAAQEAARSHARHFAERLRRRLDAASGTVDPVVTLAFDAELFGHWWYEGPDWLAALAQEAPQAGVTFTTPGAELARAEPGTAIRIPFSSWGAGGGGALWLQTANRDVYPKLHAAERRLVAAAQAGPPERGRPLAQAARELTLAQASDWAFLMARGQAGDYAARRAREHLYNCESLLRASHVDPRELTALEARHPLFPGLDPARLAPYAPRTETGEIVMLSWEFPPHAVGGLGRHVYELAHALARRGRRVSVVCPAQGEEATGTRRDGGVAVHRVRVPAAGPFLARIDALNRRLIAWALDHWSAAQVQLVHAHDWLVGRAAQTLALAWRRPLIATIHATELGRVGRIREPIQQLIHEEELLLVHHAERVITVSRAMQRGLVSGFGLEPDRTEVIYNAIDAASLWSPAIGRRAAALRRALRRPLIVFAGRLVREKGVDVLLAACARLAATHAFKLAVLGRGGERPALERLAGELGLAERVEFMGYVQHPRLGAYLRAADVVAVPSRYEPFGIVALEAMAARSALAASATGGLAEVVEHERTGLLVEPGNADAWAAALARLLDDPGLRRRLSARAAADVRARWGWDKVAQATEALYAEALAPT